MLSTKRYRHALVLGKFYPPHAGHHHLIRAASRESDRTTVVVLAASLESIPLADRVYWLAAEHWADPGVTVLGDIDDHPIDLHDDTIWDLHVGVVRAVLGRRAIADGEPIAARIDVVFSSEDYGPELARRLGAEHVSVDPVRHQYPISGSAVRADTRTYWRWLAAPTKAGLAARVVVVGAESTGTTTLSEQLARHFQTRLVIEHGRVHTERKLAVEHVLAKVNGQPLPDLESLVWTVGDFVEVAKQQAILEDDAAARGGPILVCDNDPWAATIWCERYLGDNHDEVTKTVGDRKPAMYLLTDHVGVPFTQDGWRDGEHRREWMTARFVRALSERGVPWELLTGSPEHRLRRAIRACEKMLAAHFQFATPLEYREQQ
jgi:HTH-type transcriptional regulator, transcriptional repressor of NAD biosynthesis genes